MRRKAAGLQDIDTEVQVLRDVDSDVDPHQMGLSIWPWQTGCNGQYVGARQA